MSDALSYIDQYFQEELSAEEKQAFEHRCLADPAFAQMVAFYISVHQHLQQGWAERKKQQFAHLEVSDDNTSFSVNGELKTNGSYLKEEKEVLSTISNQER